MRPIYIQAYAALQLTSTTRFYLVAYALAMNVAELQAFRLLTPTWLPGTVASKNEGVLDGKENPGEDFIVVNERSTL